MQLQMKREREERYKQNKEFQMFVTPQRETQKLDPVLPFCSTPASVAASEITTKSGTESVDAVKADTVDIQLQMKRAGEESHKQNKEFQMVATVQCDTYKIDPALPFCSTPASVAASETTTKSVTESLDAPKADIADMQFQMNRAGEERHKQNKEFQMIATDQRETQKLDPVLPFCPTPANVAASVMTAKASTESFDVQKETMDMQLQMKSTGEDRNKQNKEFQMNVTAQRETQKIDTKLPFCSNPADVAASEMTNKAVTESFDVLKADTVEVQMKSAGEDRNKHNKESQMIATAQPETQKFDHALPFGSSPVNTECGGPAISPVLPALSAVAPRSFNWSIS